jgi:Xaa-Pro aminopeptidase
MQQSYSEIKKAISKRWQRAQELMQKRQMDLLMITDDHNDYYFTQNKMSPTWKGRSRPLFLFLPSQGEPVSLLHEFKVGGAKASSFITDIRSHSQLDTSPVGEVVEILKELGGQTATVGVELGHEQWLSMPVAHFEKIKNELKEFRFVDASPLLWELRMIKDPFEIDTMRQACKVHCQAYEQMFSQIGAGMTEKDVYRKFGSAVFEAGGDQVGFFIIASGQGNYQRISGLPTDRKIEKGDMVWIDSGVDVNRYNSDYSRAGIVGKPSPQQHQMQQTIHELTAKTISVIRPGIRTSDVARACEKEAERLHLGMSFSAGRIGHGVGLMTTEPPSVALYDDTVLQAGMVLAIEPGKVTEDGIFHIEQNVAVTKTGYDIISDCDWKLRQI